MSRTMSVRLTDEQLNTLSRLARRLNQRSIGGTISLLLEEKLREEQYPAITFRNTAAGRQPFLEGTGLALWEVALIARSYGGDVDKIAEHLVISEWLALAALRYISDFRDEIDAELVEYDRMDYAELKKLIPTLELFSAGLQEVVTSDQQP